jgi:phosphoglycerol transferase MdoB-like AlkP superfamily enzyme
MSKQILSQIPEQPTQTSGRKGYPAGHWLHTRPGLVLVWFLSLVIFWSALRLVLLGRFGSAGGLIGIGGVVLEGLWRDAIAGAWLTLPFICGLLVMPARPAQWARRTFWTAALLFWFGQVFLLFVEYFFFEEFRSRFNTVAVDYLQYPTEVFINIWSSYHVGLVILICLVPAAAWTWFASRFFVGAWDRPLVHSSKPRTGLIIGAALGAVSPVVFVAGSLLGVMASPIHPKGAHISNDRTLNEIANNGEFAFFSAALTHHLEYTAFYKTLPREQAFQLTRQLLAGPGVKLSERSDSLCRAVAGDPARPRLNLVILLEESFGSEFWGSLGRKHSLTPEMDKLAAAEGMLFTNLFASGNRTVRGMEGVLASFPPLPGESIVKREFSDHVETVARVLKRDGYSTMFLYGGRGVFDGMRSFVMRNGYDRFVEQKHFEHPTFTTVWGVCDEDLYDRSIQEFRELAKTGQPFFATVLSVSNHKPYTYPPGRIAENPNQRRRENAVKYSDFALGEFFRKARQESFWTNTIFAVVADHGARVYGEQSIPIHSYEIPLLVVGPAAIGGPSRVGQLGCSLDVGPTLLGMIGRPYTSTFFGQDLLKSPPENGRALLNHNRDIGLLSGNRLVVLGLKQGEEFYGGNPKVEEMRLLPHPDAKDRDLEKEAMAIFQAADDLYTHQRYRLEDAAENRP